MLAYPIASVYGRTLFHYIKRAHIAMKAFHIAPTLPLDIGILHFVGIGGIGMSGIAEVLHNMGYQVQGSDQADNANIDRLKKLGIPVMIGHKPEHVRECAAVVKSTAVQMDNPEIMEARRLGVPVIRRSEMLRELMRLKIALAVGGTHGKTTTTSLMAALFDKAGLDPTVINGGVLNAYGTNAYLGSGDWMIVEADESDGTFIRIPASVAVVTNIDPEHLDHWGSFANLKEAFVDFLQHLPFYGFAVLCIDHQEVQSIIPRISDRRIVTYGTSPQADIRAVNVRSDLHGSLFDVEINTGERSPRTVEGLRLPIPGLHNVRNALAVMGVANELGMDDTVMKEAMLGFKGVKRRFTRTGQAGGVTIIDDYGHHPVEIAATLKAARDSLTAQGNGQLLAVVQPHRYTRLRDLFDDFCRCFNDADHVLVADIYAAGEDPIEGVTKEALVEGLAKVGHKSAHLLASRETLAQQVESLTSDGDMVVCLGAGNITQWAQQLPQELEAIQTRHAAKRA